MPNRVRKIGFTAAEGLSWFVGKSLFTPYDVDIPLRKVDGRGLYLWKYSLYSSPSQWLIGKWLSRGGDKMRVMAFLPDASVGWQLTKVLLLVLAYGCSRRVFTHLHSPDGRWRHPFPNLLHAICLAPRRRKYLWSLDLPLSSCIYAPRPPPIHNLGPRGRLINSSSSIQ